ncbi:hypothetical protein Bsp3421_003303 [Burkholderia sp. FERM BP-3421]|uniref:hypothetical protein n=1 Tax=Burkholderia sp. FERM BP-3421 TaxID=1494466 RepID=UPI002361BC6B|nr:hypothetical protein [Burkholderia sp. FERM BP-3421]WDD93239.1 hypothetical protein Bsp3421_003303 [Burkholderia sp. FERM BP-3421]
MTGFPADQSDCHVHSVGFISNLNHPDLEGLRYLSMTLYGENRGQNHESEMAVARDIKNRLNTGRWGDAYQSAVTVRLQFTCWNKDVEPNGHAAIHNPVGDPCDVPHP